MRKRLPEPEGRQSNGAAPTEMLQHPGWYLRIGAWCGMVSGFASLVVLAGRRLLRGFIFYPIETVWREPVSAVFFLSVVAALFAVGRRVWPRAFSWRLLLGIELFVGGFGTLLLVPRLHWAASAVLAAGIAYQLTRLAERHAAAFVALLRTTLPPGLAVILAAVVLVPGERYWRGRRALHPFDTTAASAPNVLLIILDTVRAWDMSVYGYSRPTTPVLERLASRGVLFQRAVSPAPWTLPSHASLFTGYWPHELSADWTRPLDHTLPTLAEVLGARGYLTAGFCANVRYCSYETGLSRGFAHYEDYNIPLHRALMAGPLLRLYGRLSSFFRTDSEPDADDKSRDATTIKRAFLAWLDRSHAAGTGQPFFAFLNFFDAHRPYTSPDSFHIRFSTPGVPFTPNLLPRSGPRRAWDARAVQGSKDAYDASIAYIDSELGLLYDELDRRGLLANTVIVITSDHGEEFTEHGMIGHGNSLYRSALMVPLIFIAPGRIPAARRIEATVSTRDVPRTLLELIRSGAEAQLPGQSLARFWQSPPDTSSIADPVLSTVRFAPRLPSWYQVSHGPVRSVVEGNWRYIVEQDGTEELFDFATDSLERHNLVTTDSGRAVSAWLRAHLDSLTRVTSGSGSSRR